MKVAQVLTPWTNPEPGVNYPKIVTDYQLVAYRDATDQPVENITPDPNLFVAKIICTEEVLSAIEADPTYHVLWSTDL